MLDYTSTKSTPRAGLHHTGSVHHARDPMAFFEINEILNDQGHRPAYRQARQKLHTIIWIKEGRGELFIDLQRYEFFENTTFYLEPGQLYHLGPQTKARGYHICFSGSFLDMSEMFIGLPGAGPRFQQGSVKTVIWGTTIQNDLQYLVEEMIKESLNDFILGAEVLRGLIGIFMMHLARNSSQDKSYTGTAHDDQLAKKFLNLLRENVYARKMVSDYANELAISANYLNQVMKRYTGFTASYHIQKYTILEAKRRALYFGTSMKETAYYLGFDDLAHFSKYFKKNAGTSFREFNNQMKRSNLDAVSNIY